MKVPAYDDLGKEMRELLNGSIRSGLGSFQYDQKLSVNLMAANGVKIAAKAVRTGGSRFDTSFKGTWTNGPITVEALPAMPKTTVKVAHTVAPGLKVTLSDELPNPTKKGKATIEYSQPHVNSKFVVGLNSAVPVEAAAAVGWNGFVAGGRANVDVRSSKVSAYSLALAYMGPNFVATGHMTEKGRITGTYWQKVDIMSSVAAEVIHETSSNDVALTMGYSYVENDGTHNKVKISNKGDLQFHRDMKLTRDSTLGVSVSANAMDTTQVPAVGCYLDYSP